jgi:hypothetical protein
VVAGKVKQGLRLPPFPVITFLIQSKMNTVDKQTAAILLGMPAEGIDRLIELGHLRADSNGVDPDSLDALLRAKSLCEIMQLICKQ